MIKQNESEIDPKNCRKTTKNEFEMITRYDYKIFIKTIIKSRHQKLFVIKKK